ncbi:morphogenic membrane protein MmpB [Kitasatospora humi]|nr:hypothetical protein [Kitasatospora humi]
MLWSDPSHEPSPEARRAAEMLRRAGRLLAFAVLLMAVVLILC